MIRQVLRQDIFSTNKNITSLIHELQNVIHEDDEDGFESEKNKADYDAQYDILEIKTEDVDQYNTVINFAHENVDTFATVLSEKIVFLLETYGVKSLYIISGLKMNLLGSKRNKYKPLKNSLLRFEKLTGIKNSDEAFEVDLQNMQQAIETFFWLQRVDSSSPEFLYFTDKDDRFAFNICKYGNIHLTEFDEELITNEFLDNEGWEIVNERCSDQFSETSVIEGREASR